MRSVSESTDLFRHVSADKSEPYRCINMSLPRPNGNTASRRGFGRGEMGRHAPSDIRVGRNVFINQNCPPMISTGSTSLMML